MDDHAHIHTKNKCLKNHDLYYVQVQLNWVQLITRNMEAYLENEVTFLQSLGISPYIHLSAISQAEFITLLQNGF